MKPQSISDNRQCGVVAVVREGERFLVIRRSQYVRAPGAYCFPGGGIQPDESEQRALVREMREELACEIVPLARVWQSVTAWHVRLSWWVVDAPKRSAFFPDPREVESVHWLTASEMRMLPGLLSSNRAFLDAWQNGEINLNGHPESGD